MSVSLVKLLLALSLCWFPFILSEIPVQAEKWLRQLLQAKLSLLGEFLFNLIYCQLTQTAGHLSSDVEKKRDKINQINTLVENLPALPAQQKSDQHSQELKPGGNKWELELKVLEREVVGHQLSWMCIFNKSSHCLQSHGCLLMVCLSEKWRAG